MRQPAATPTVLWGRCLRFGAVESTYLPLVLAIEGWLQEASDEAQKAVLSGVAGASLLAAVARRRRAHRPGAADAGRRRDPLEDRRAGADRARRRRRPVGGPGVLGRTQLPVCGVPPPTPGSHHHPSRRGLPPGNRSGGWLADMRRMPFVSTLPLGRLRAEETEAQLSSSWRGPVRQRLLREVGSSGRGATPISPRCWSLDCRQTPTACRTTCPTRSARRCWPLGTGCRHPPAGWRRCWPSVGGPRVSRISPRSLRACGLAPSGVEDAVGEAVAQGIVVPNRAGGLVPAPAARRDPARHPAARPGVALARGLGDAPWNEQRRPGSRSCAGSLPWRCTTRRPRHRPRRSPSRCVPPRLARELGAPRAEARHLQRAVRLSPPAHPGSGPDPAYLDLLEEAAHACALVGEQERAADLWQQAVALVDEGDDPLRASRLLIALSAQEWGLGRVEEQPVAVAAKALRRPDERPIPTAPSTPESLANLAWCAYWVGDERTAAEAAESGVEAARLIRLASGPGRGARRRAFVLSTSADTGRRTSMSPCSTPSRSDDLELLADAFISQVNYEGGRGQIAAQAATARRALDDLLARGGVIGVPMFAQILAHSLLTLGLLRAGRGGGAGRARHRRSGQRSRRVAARRCPGRRATRSGL